MMLLDGLDLLTQLDPLDLIALFWFTVIVEIPRYSLSFLAVLLAEAQRLRAARLAAPPDLTVSVLLAGHCEAHAVAHCVLSLREQTWCVVGRPLEIICVDDGSTDGMAAVLADLRRRGLIDVALTTGRRAGKSAAVNLAAAAARGEVLVVADIDCSFDRDCIERLVAPFADARVGAVCGNIGVRNARRSLIAALQAIEYLVAISGGRRGLDAVGMVACVSGALGAFRRKALAGVGWMDVGPGEDLDVTLRLRRAGWTIRFAPDSWCLTDVPETLLALLRQRRRWERDSLRLRLRKHRDLLAPQGRGFSMLEAAQQLDFILFVLVPTLVFPTYLVWLFWTHGEMAPVVLLAVMGGYALLDAFSFVVSWVVSGPRAGASRLLPYALVYGLYSGWLLRFARLAAFAEEWIFRTSYRDSYVPPRVLRQAPWW